MKACPFCAEQIQDVAVVCRFCNRDLPATAPMALAASSKPVRTGGLFDWLFHGWIKPAVQCRQCRATGCVRTLWRPLGATKAFCSNCRTRWTF